MLAADEDALICDLAETYHIFDCRAVPLQMLARLCCGLRENSRIRMILAGTRADTTQILLAGIADRLGNLVWMLSEDGHKGIHQPASVLAGLLDGEPGGEEQSGAIRTFATPEAYEAAMRAARGGDGRGD